MEPEFVCRSCGDTRLFEVMADVVVHSECRLTEDGVQYDEQTNEDGHIDRYQCGVGHVVVDLDGEKITDPESLAGFLWNYPPLTRETVIGLIADRLREVDKPTLRDEYNSSYPADDLRIVGGFFIRGKETPI